MKTYTNNIIDQELEILESDNRVKKAEINRLFKENEDIKTAIVNLMEKYAVELY